jgi:hypothetical protein
LKKTIKHIFYALLGLVVGFLTLALLVFNSNTFQNWITAKVTDYLSAQFKTKITIGHIRYFPFTGFELDNVYWGDQKSDTLFYVNELKFNLGGFDQADMKLTLNDVVVDGAYCKIITYPDSTFNIDVLQNITDPNDSISDPNSPAFKLYFNRVACHNTRFRLVDSTSVFETEGFDGLNENFYNIEMLARDFWIIEDSLHFDLKKMSCNEISGIRVEHMSAITTISSTSLHFDSLEMRTPNSRVADYLHIDYNGWEELADYNEKAVMTGKLVQSRVDMQDISYFAPFLRGIQHTFLINGEGSGTVSNLRMKNLDVTFGRASAFKGSGSIRGLPDIEETFMDIKAERAATTKTDLERLITIDLPGELNRLGVMKFEGRFTGFYNDFVTFGSFNTDLGGGTSDLNMKMGDSSELPSYSGSLALKDFDMGGLTGQQVIGKTSLKASVDGQGFNLKDIRSTINTEITYFEANHYHYKNISLGGKLEHKMFAGKLDINDENAEVHFDGTIDLNKEIPLYKFKASIDYADLQKLHFDTSNLVFSTNIDINFAMKDLDENNGEITLTKSLFIKNGIDYPIDMIRLSSEMSGGTRAISVEMDNILSASMSGTYSFEQIPVTAQSMLHQLLPGFVDDVRRQPSSPQNFTYKLQLSDSRILTEIFYPELIIEGADISGSMNGRENDFNMQGSIDQVIYSGYRFKNIVVSESLANGSTSNLKITIASFEKNDTVFTKDVRFSSMIRDNIAHTTFVIADTSGLVYTGIDAESLFDRNIVRTGFSSSTFTFKHKEFRISDQGIVLYDRIQNKITISDLKLSHGKESIDINGFYESGSGYSLKADIADIRLSLVNLFYEELNYKLNGTTNGSITLKGDNKDIYLNTYLNVEQLTLDNDTIGDFSITSNYDENQKRLLSYVRSVSGKLKALEMGGYIDMSKSPYELNYSVIFGESDLRSFQAFVKDDLTIYYGKVSAKCKITGPLNNIQVDGSLNMMQVLARVEYLKTVYGFSSRIDFTKNGIVINPFQVTDINGKQARVEGRIDHQAFSNFNFNLKMGELNGFQLLNTAAGDNSLFYGKAYATGRMSLTGPQNDLTLDATLKSSKGTVFAIPLSESDDTDGDDLLNFVDKDTSVKTVAIKKNSSLIGFSMNMMVTITPDAQIQIVFDEQQDDKIIGTGKGTLRMEMTKQGTFNMFGEVGIEDGEYKFTAVDVFTRKFVLRRGGTITWTGDPLLATMNIEGVYRVRNTSVADIITTATDAERSAIKQQRVPVECLLYLKGRLLHPDISFDLNFPDNTGTLGTTNASALQNSLRKLRSDPQLMEQQVMSLMLFGTFAPAAGIGQAANNSGGINNELNNTVSDLISAQANNLISKIIPGFEVSADYQSYQATASQSQQSRTILTATQNLLNERLQLRTSFDLERAGSNNNFMGQYSITPDGNLKLTGYNRTNNTTDPLNYNKNVTTQGIGLYYRKEFDKFNEFIRKKNRKVVVSE